MTDSIDANKTPQENVHDLVARIAEDVEARQRADAVYWAGLGVSADDSSALPDELRRRRGASDRFERMSDGRRDPLDPAA